MQTLLSISVVFLITLNGLLAQVQHQFPLPFASNFEGVYVAANDLGFAVGSCATILKTIDGGQNWIQVESPAQEELLQIACRPGTGCAQVFATGTSTLYSSLDGGENWSAVEIPGNGTIKGIVFTGDDETVVISRNVTTLTLSNDNGQTFEQVFMGHAPATLMQFVSPSRGFFFSNMTDLITTDDGGQTWSNLYDHSEGVRGMNFLNEDTGFMYSGSGLVFKTTDGGNTWAEISNYESIRFLFTGMEAKSEMEIEMTTTRGVHRSVDGGLTFTELININSNSNEFNDVRLNDIHRQGEQYYLAGDNTSILYSGDDLETVSHQLGDDRTPFNAIDLRGNNIYALTSQDGLVRSTDGGATFETPVIDGFLSGTDLLVLQDDRVVVAGNGSPKVSVDQGESFNNFLPATGIPSVIYRQVEQLETGRIVVGGESGTAIYSDDNAQNWTTSNHGLHNTLLQLSSFGQTLGLNTRDSFAVSLDGGASWPIQQAMPDNVGVQPVFFALDENTWIISIFPSGNLERTDDGGQTWESLSVQANEIIMGDNGRIYATNSTQLIFSDNLGASWEPASDDFCSPFGLTFVGMAYDADTERVFVAGRGRRLFSINVAGVISSVRSTTAIDQLDIFPNPTSGQLSIELTESTTNGPVTVELFNLTGRQITQHRFGTNERIELNYSTQAAGAYLIKVSGNGWSKTSKIIIAR